MSKRAVLMMTFGSPEEITYEGVAEFFTNIPYMTITSELVERRSKG